MLIKFCCYFVLHIFTIIAYAIIIIIITIISFTLVGDQRSVVLVMGRPCVGELLKLVANFVHFGRLNGPSDLRR